MRAIQYETKVDNPPCQILEWDTGFFGFRIARTAEARLSRDKWPLVQRWCKAEGVRCLYLLASSEQMADTDFLVGECKFRLVDIRITLDRNATPRETAEGIRFAEAKDVPALATIARSSHTDSRFYTDPGFPRERCDALFQTWIEKSCGGYARTVLVAERDMQPAGYITCDWSGDTGQIGLVAVAPWARGAGIGRNLVQSSIGIFQQNGVKRIAVVTQGRNIAAQRLYQRCGFATGAVQLWYHRWFFEAGK